MEKSKVRMPAVAGQFYQSQASALKNQIEGLLGGTEKKIDVIACMLPHAGYMYSGRVAAQTVQRINIKDKVILLGPNHTGCGAQFSIMTKGAWQTPLGAVKIDNLLAKQILKSSRYLEDDAGAHLKEHSLEVELPLLQYFRPDFEIVPIVVIADEISILKEIGKDIALAVKDSNLVNTTMIVASSDLTHYEPQAQAIKNDREALNAILDLDEDRLMEKVQQLGISMCGYAPVAVMLVAAKLLGAKAAKLIIYKTSGDITADHSSVVGYAGCIIY
jgi:AmmeMemoRadiSam system protein B